MSRPLKNFLRMQDPQPEHQAKTVSIEDMIDVSEAEMILSDKNSEFTSLESFWKENNLSS